MLIQQIRLRNFRNHSDVTFNFTAGVNAVLGCNGSGKSSVIEAIRYLLFGEGYGTKAEMLKVGELTGFVEGVVVLDDDKPVNIWRAIEASKVKLTYDGVDYIKATDVKILWDKLFQIDGNVFKNVNVAAQGEIPLLFSGDESVRRTIFQKVFMVPNTATLRNVVWDYIKEAPPEYPILSDIEAIGTQQQIADCEAQIVDLNARIALLTVLSTEEQTTLQREILQAKQCIAGVASREQHKTNIAAAKKKIKELQAAVAGYKEDLKAAPELSLLTTMDKTYVMQKAQNEAQQQNVAKRKALEAKLAPSEVYAELVATKDGHSILLCVANEHLSSCVAELTNIKNQKQKLGCFSGKKECPTCGQAITDIANVLSQLDASLPATQATYAQYKGDVDRLTKVINDCEATLKSQDNIKQQIANITSLLVDVVPYDETAHTGILQAIIRLSDLTTKYKQAEADLRVVQLTEENAEKLLQSVPAFEDVRFATAEDLITWHVVSLRAHADNVKAIHVHKMTIHTLQTKIVTLQEHVARSHANKLKNEQRQKYTDSLQSIYNVLHPSQFSALLIKSYAKTLEQKIVKYLSQFNFKYSVKITDEFSVNVYNEDVERLPKVSGGQAMVIGLSLRLALHDMFSQSLSLFCCDEPTQGLDTEKQSLLFELVENLKQSGIKQIIIIDHNTALSRVVDNVITLET